MVRLEMLWRRSNKRIVILTGFLIFVLGILFLNAEKYYYFYRFYTDQKNTEEQISERITKNLWQPARFSKAVELNNCRINFYSERKYFCHRPSQVYSEEIVIYMSEISRIEQHRGFDDLPMRFLYFTLKSDIAKKRDIVFGKPLPNPEVFNLDSYSVPFEKPDEFYYDQYQKEIVERLEGFSVKSNNEKKYCAGYIHIEQDIFRLAIPLMRNSEDIIESIADGYRLACRFIKY